MFSPSEEGSRGDEHVSVNLEGEHDNTRSGAGVGNTSKQILPHGTASPTDEQQRAKALGGGINEVSKSKTSIELKKRGNNLPERHRGNSDEQLVSSSKHPDAATARSMSKHKQSFRAQKKTLERNNNTHPASMVSSELPKGVRNPGAPADHEGEHYGKLKRYSTVRIRKRSDASSGNTKSRNMASLKSSDSNIFRNIAPAEYPKSSAVLTSTSTSSFADVMPTYQAGDKESPSPEHDSLSGKLSRAMLALNDDLENFEDQLKDLKLSKTVPESLLDVPADEVRVETIKSIYRVYPNLPAGTPASVTHVYDFYRDDNKRVVYKSQWYGAGTSQKEFLNAHQGRLYQARLNPDVSLEVPDDDRTTAVDAVVADNVETKMTSPSKSSSDSKLQDSIESTSYNDGRDTSKLDVVEAVDTRSEPVTEVSSSNDIDFDAEKFCSEIKISLEGASETVSDLLPSSPEQQQTPAEDVKDEKQPLVGDVEDEKQPLVEDVEDGKQPQQEVTQTSTEKDSQAAVSENVIAPVAVKRRSSRRSKRGTSLLSRVSTSSSSSGCPTNAQPGVVANVCDRKVRDSEDTEATSTPPPSVRGSGMSPSTPRDGAMQARVRKFSDTVLPNFRAHDGSTEADIPASESTSMTFDLDTSIIDEPGLSKDALKNMKSVFEVFKPTSIDIHPIDSIGHVKHTFDVSMIPVLLQMKALHGPSNEEVFFASAAFYDIEKKVRLSEMFYFDWIGEQELLYSIIHQYYPTSGKSMLNTKNIYMRFVAPPSPHIYLIVRVSTTPREDLDALFDLYSNSNMNPKDLSKMVDQSRRILNRFGKYQQAFGWLAVQIFDEKLNFKLTSKQDFYLYKMKQNMSDLALMDYFYSEEGSRKMKKIDIYLQLSGFLCTPDKIRLLNYYGSSLIGFLSQEKAPGTDYLEPSLDKGDSVKQLIKPPRLISDSVYHVQEFLPPSVPVKNIHQDFVNNLYIYPLNLTISGSKSKYKNLVIYVYLMEEDNGVQNALRTIYGRSYEEMFTKCFITSVFTENTNTHNEIKIKLPLKLKSTHHLLFLVYSLNMRMKKDKDNEPTESFLGYAWYPIYSNSRILKGREYHTQFVPCKEVSSVWMYMARGCANVTENDKNVLSFRSELVSTVLSEDEHISRYLDSLNEGAKLQKRTLLMVVKAHPDVLFMFSLFIIHHAVSEICQVRASMQLVLFKMLTQVALCVFDQLNMSTSSYEQFQCSNLLQSYVTYHFDTPKQSSVLTAEVIAANWNAILQEAYSNNSGGVDSAATDKNTSLPSENATTMNANVRLANRSLRDVAFFFFGIIVKSLTLKKHEMNLSGRELTTPSLQKSLRGIFTQANYYRQRYKRCFQFLNRILARTCNQLFTLLDRGFVLQLVHQHICNLDKAEDMPDRILFIKIVSAYEHYVVLNKPGLQPEDIARDDTADVKARYVNHYMASLLVGELRTLLLCDIPQLSATRYEAISMLRNLLWKHHLDDRIHTRWLLPLVAGLYMPFWSMVVENVRILTNVTPTPQDHPERKEWCLCAFWIITTVDTNLYLRPWLRCQSVDNLLKLFVLLRTLYDTFADDQPLYRMLQLFLLHLYTLFMEELQDQMLQSGSKFFEPFSLSILYSLRGMADEELILGMAQVIGSYISQLRRPLFRHLDVYTICGDLTYALLNVCILNSKKTRIAASSLLYLMMRTNCSEMGHFARMKLHFTSAISRIVKREDCNYEALLSTLGSIKRHRDTKKFMAPESQIPQFMTANIHFVYDYVHIYTLSNNFLKTEMYYRISCGYVNHPDLRISWLDDLARLQESLENYAEAACCNLQIASLISEYLTKVIGQKRDIKVIPDSTEIRSKIFSCICKEEPLSLVWLENNTILSPDFSEDGYTKFMLAAADLFAKANEYNLTIECLFALIYYYKENNRWEPLSSAAQQVSTIAHDLYDANRSQSRIPPNYYRVGFYGKDFEDNGKEYIYRENPSVRLSEFTANIEQSYEKQVGAGNLKILGNKPIEEVELDPEKNYLQIVSCEIYLDYDELVARDYHTYCDQSINVRHFSFELPYSPDGSGNSEEIGKSWKRKIILTANKCFPYMLQRLPVAEKEIKILPPVESALDLMLTIVSRFKQALNRVPPNSKTVQIILQGSVLTQVNAGPLAIIKEFLGDASKYPADIISKLGVQVKTFVRLCQFGLRLNATLIETKPELAPLHEEICKAFVVLRDEASKHLNIQ